MGEFVAPLQDVHDFRDVVGHQILVGHGQQGQVDARHGADLTRPESAGVHQVLAIYGALFGDDLPALGRRVGLQHAVVQDDLGAAHAGRLGIGMGRARGVEVAVQRVIEAAEDALGVHKAIGQLVDFLRSQDLGVQPHVAVLGAFGLQLLEAGLVVGQRHAADMVQPAGHAGDGFQLFVEADRIALQRRHVGVAVDRVEASRRVPGGARGQLGALDQHDVRPAELGQVVENRTADDAAADHHHAGMGFHGTSSQRICARKPRLVGKFTSEGDRKRRRQIAAGSLPWLTAP